MGFADLHGLTTAAGTLYKTGKTVGRAAAPVSSGGASAARAVGDESLAQAMRRFGAAWSTSISDTSTQLNAAAFLANNFAADMACATGEQMPTLLPPWSDLTHKLEPEPSASHWKQLP